MAVQKISITLDEQLMALLNEFCEQRRVSRSAVIAMALSDWIDSYSVLAPPVKEERSKHGKNKRA